jgi:hypothetical protein
MYNESKIFINEPFNDFTYKFKGRPCCLLVVGLVFELLVGSLVGLFVEPLVGLSVLLLAELIVVVS